MVIIAYTTIGGLLGDALTDMLQGAVMMIGLTVLLIVLLASGDFSFAEIKPEQLTWVISDEEGNPESLVVGARYMDGADPRLTCGPGGHLAFPGGEVRQHCAQGLLPCRGSLHRFRLRIPLMIGLLGHAAGFEATSNDSYLPELARQYLSPVMYILLMGAIVSAILSTVDTTLLAVSAIASRNLIDPIARNLPEPRKLMFAVADPACWPAGLWHCGLG